MLRLISLICLISISTFAMGDLFSRKKIDAIPPPEIKGELGEQNPLIKLKSNEKEAVVIQLMMNRIRKSHVAPKLLNNQYSKDVFNTYLELLDYNKQFFINEDILRFKKHETRLDDELLELNFDFMTRVNQQLDARINSVNRQIEKVLDTPFDFSIEDVIEFDGKKRRYVDTEKELKKRWWKTVKYQTLLNYMDLYRDKINKEHATKKDNVMVYDYEMKIDEKIEKQAREKTKKNLTQMFDRLNKETDEEAFSVYLNALSTVNDPHTTYFLPERKQDFDINIRGSLEGIGAILTEKDGMIEVKKVIRGSAAWRQGKLKAQDKILSVAQSVLDPVNIVGMRVRDAVKLIRGKKGTEVRLNVKHLDGSVEIVPIIRDVVRIEESYAKGCVIKNSETNGKIGYILLPGFYRNFENAREPNAADDVRKEIRKLKTENIEGLILDLRNNSGGALRDAIKIVGWFIPKGPVVQAVSNQRTKVHVDNDPRVEYEGPLVVMVNGQSASASEIVASALQDYGRAIIIGSGPTYGKGSVQTFINLDHDNRNELLDLSEDPLGSLKLTIQKYYRVNGLSTQYQGVLPDIDLPDTLISEGEKEQNFSLKTDEVKPAKYKEWASTFDLENIKMNSVARVGNSKFFDEIRKRRQELESQKNDSKRSLNVFRSWKNQGELRKKQKAFSDIFIQVPSLSFAFPVLDQLSFEDKEEKENWLKSIQKDIYIEEATFVLADMLTAGQAFTEQ